MQRPGEALDLDGVQCLHLGAKEGRRAWVSGAWVVRLSRGAGRTICSRALSMSSGRFATSLLGLNLSVEKLGGDG